MVDAFFFLVQCFGLIQQLGSAQFSPCKCKCVTHICDLKYLKCFYCRPVKIYWPGPVKLEAADMDTELLTSTITINYYIYTVITSVFCSRKYCILKPSFSFKNVDMLAFLHCSHHLQTHEHTHRKHIRLNTHQIYYVQVIQYSQNSFCLLLMEEHIERKSKGCASA